MCFCYILNSKKLGKYYIGATHQTVQERLIKHNSQAYGTNHFTAKACDWEIYISIQVSNYPHAIRLERKIKSRKSSAFIRNLKKYPELLAKIIAQTK